MQLFLNRIGNISPIAFNHFRKKDSEIVVSAVFLLIYIWVISNTVHCSSQTYENISFGDELNVALENLVQMYKATQEMKVSVMFHIHAICM